MDADMDEWLWPASCAELRQIESTLRCLICGEFFHGPVVLPCSHTFCSECVRRFLQSRGNHGCCPECKQPCTSGELVPNRSLEKIGVLFQQMKPKVLPILEKAKGLEEKATTGPKTNGESKAPERMTPLSYSVMKEKDIKKLLESIGIRVPIKNRDDIIQIHKEYVLLANAQADSSHPKSAKQVRDEVMRNYRARQAEKSLLGSARKAQDANAPLSEEMKGNFARLQEQLKARKTQQQAKAQDGDGVDKVNENVSEAEGTEIDTTSGGLWRHVYDVKSDTDFYIHSITNEIRAEAPRAFLEHQQRVRERREQVKADDDDDEPVIVETRSARPSQAEEPPKANQDDDDDFEMLVTTPPPKPPLGSRNSTPQSLSSSARKARRRSSVGSTSSNGVAAFFSQETACSIQQTSTQNAPSASLSLSTPTSVDDATDVSCSQALETRWDCPRCTLMNDNAAACEACGYVRQDRPVRKKQKLQSKLYS